MHDSEQEKRIDLEPYPPPYKVRMHTDVVTKEGDLIADCRTSDHAAYLVKACNEYPAMRDRIAEMEDALRAAEYFVANHKIISRGADEDALAKIRAALNEGD